MILCNARVDAAGNRHIAFLHFARRSNRNFSLLYLNTL